MASHTKNISGIIYRTYNSGISDKVVNVISNNGKKITCIAKAIKSQNSKKAYSIEIGNLVKLQLLEGYALPLITDVILQNEFSHWKKDLKGITSLQFICEIVDNFTYEESPAPEVFDLFEEVLNHSSASTLLKLSYFLLKLLNITGNLPELDKYNDNEEPIVNGEAYFSSDIIGFVSKEVGQDSNLISPLIYKTQKFFLAKDLKNSLKINLSDDLCLSMFRIHLGWLNQVIDKKLKTFDLLMKVI